MRIYWITSPHTGELRCYGLLRQHLLPDNPACFLLNLMQNKHHSHLHHAIHIVRKIKKDAGVIDERAWQMLCYRIVDSLIYNRREVHLLSGIIYFKGDNIIRYNSINDKWQEVISPEIFCEALSYSCGAEKLFHFIKNHEILIFIMNNKLSAISKSAINGVIRSLYVTSPTDVTNPGWHKYTIQLLDKISGYYCNQIT